MPSGNLNSYRKSACPIQGNFKVNVNDPGIWPRLSMSLPTFSPRGAQAVQYGSWPCAEGTCWQHWTFADPCDVRVFAFTERAFAHILVI